MSNATDGLTDAEKEAVRAKQGGEPFNRGDWNRAKDKLDKTEKFDGSRDSQTSNADNLRRGDMKMSESGWPCLHFAISLDVGEEIELLRRVQLKIAAIESFRLLNMVVEAHDGEITATVYFTPATS
jgi:hypothetical protein